jgi:hypothetical protein
MTVNQRVNLYAKIRELFNVCLELMNIGDRVRVSKSVIVYHHPQHRQNPFDIKGIEGEIKNIIEKPVSANLPIFVQFDKKFKAHFQESELEVIS